MNNETLNTENRVTIPRATNQQIEKYITNEKGGLWGKELDTIAQIGTALIKDDPVLLQGVGYGIDDSRSKYRLARSKFLTQNLIMLIMDIAKEKKNKDLIASLWRTYRCLNVVHEYEGRLYGKRCKTRFCTVCSGIRKADMIRKYLPILKSWPDPHFITLTSKSSDINNLDSHIRETICIFNKIKAKLKKRYQRGNGPRIIGIRSIESNFNPDAKTYNPHIHILLPSYEVASLLRNEWINYFDNPKIVNPKVQDIRPVRNTEKSLIEVIKYASTIFTDKLKGLKNQKQDKEYHIYVKAMYNLIVAMGNHRLFASFGFELPKDIKLDPITKLVNDSDKFKYHPKIADFVCEETGEKLLQFHPSYSLLDKLKNDVDNDLE